MIGAADVVIVHIEIEEGLAREQAVVGSQLGLLPAEEEPQLPVSLSAQIEHPAEAAGVVDLELLAGIGVLQFPLNASHRKA